MFYVHYFQIGEVLESGPPASRNNRSSVKSESEESRPQSPASSTYSDAPRPRRFRKRNRMKTRVSNSGGASAEKVAENGNGRRSRLHSVDQVYLTNSNNNPLSPRTRSSVKQEIDEEVSFV